MKECVGERPNVILDATQSRIEEITNHGDAMTPTMMSIGTDLHGEMGAT
jgi:hypothetical protein